jgi:predicted nucleic acid-binding Zn ribbon protein
MLSGEQVLDSLSFKSDISSNGSQNPLNKQSKKKKETKLQLVLALLLWKLIIPWGERCHL